MDGSATSAWESSAVRPRSSVAPAPGPAAASSSTDRRAPAGFAPIAIGLGLTLIHLIGIPVTNLSVNPARSTGPAVFVQGWALAQLWLFWVAPIVGALIAGWVYSRFLDSDAVG